MSPSHKHYKKSISNAVIAWNKIYKHSFLKKFRLEFDEEVKIHEDVPFATKVFMCAEKSGYLDRKLYGYRYNDNSIMTAYKEDYVERVQPLIRKMRQLLLQELADKELGRNLFNERMCIMIAQCMERYYCMLKIRYLIRFVRKNG